MAEGTLTVSFPRVRQPRECIICSRLLLRLTNQRSFHGEIKTNFPIEWQFQLEALLSSSVYIELFRELDLWNYRWLNIFCLIFWNNLHTSPFIACRSLIKLTIRANCPSNFFWHYRWKKQNFENLRPSFVT